MAQEYNQALECLQNNGQVEEKSIPTYVIEQLFDSSNELLKSIVREIFDFQRQSLDGFCAAAIHMLQSQHLKGYYDKRKYRLFKEGQQDQLPLEEKEDKFVQIYFNENFFNDIEQERYSRQDQHDFRRDPDFTIEDEQMIKQAEPYHTEVVQYIRSCADIKYAHHQAAFRKTVRMHTTRALKIISAVISLWIPGMRKLVSDFTGYTQQKTYDYSEIVFGRFKDDKKDGESSPKKVVEMVISKDNLSNGLIDDLELIFQLIIDQGTYKLKLISKKGLNIGSRCLELFNYKECSFQNIDSMMFSRIFLGVNQFIMNQTLFQKTLPALPMRFCKSFRNLFSSMSRNFYIPSAHLFNQNIDRQSVLQNITQQGYECEKIEPTTEDGYILQMTRIINRKSPNSVFMQHGLLDTCWTWIIHGPGESLGFEALESGYDVYMGNYRGVYPRKVAPNFHGPDFDYWDYSIDHIAKYDIHAFLKAIMDIKTAEFKHIYPEKSEEQIKKELKITYVGHSLGGMVLPMYLIFQKMLNREHYLSKAILLSPAGTHFHANWLIQTGGTMASYVIPLISNNVHVPELLMDILKKVMNDIKYLPAADDFVNYLASQMLGGPPQSGKQAVLTKTTKMFSSLLHFGWSNTLAQHMLRVYKVQKFCSFDFGAERNMKMFGQSEPLDYLKMFDKIDIPVHYYLSLEDHLCRPDDVLLQYMALRESNKSLAHIKVFDGYSHIDFTYLNHHSMISEIMKTLKGQDPAWQSEAQDADTILSSQRVISKSSYSVENSNRENYNSK